MIAQGLAVKRLDQIRALVLSNTAAKIGTPQIWADRIGAIRAGGIEAVADATMQRWFTAPFRAGTEIAAWRNMMVRQPLEGYLGCAHAVAGSDFITPTSGLTLPTLAIAGSEDGSTPPDMVRETADLIRGSRFELIRGAGHLPPVEKPAEYAQALRSFFASIAHG
jgi:3-oxoadipate enol-lactonase